ncbi:hypothetical protein J132_05573 [Termitomyces sp. J132]|nr:hypothetical protein J132_05573 [Termitomyces sp. J132]
MAHAFLDQVDRLLTVACVSLAKDPCLAVTAIFQMWLQWFKTAGSGVEWPELATVKKECRQLYKWYKGEEWVHPFDVHFASVYPSLEFLMDDLMAGMTVSALAVASTSNTTKHPVGALAVARGEGQSEGHEGEEAANCGDIQEAGPLTPKAVAGGIARGLATSPRLATTPRSKGKGKGKAWEEEDEDIEDQIEETFTNKRLATLLHWQKASTVVDTGLGAGVKLEKAKGKVMVPLERRQQYKHMQGTCDHCWANNNPKGCWYPMGVQPCYRCDSTRKSCSHSGRLSRSTSSKFAKKIAMKAVSVRNTRAFVKQQRELVRRGKPIKVKHLSLILPTSQEEAVIGGGGGAKVKSREMVESDKDSSNNDSDGDVPLAQKQAASPVLVASAKQSQTVASEEGEGDVEMGETTPLAMVAEVEREASGMEIEGEEELKVIPVTAEEEERGEEVEGTWSNMPLCQVGDDELEWLGKDLGWPTPLTSAASLVDFDKRAVGVERQFQRELEAAREELLAVRACYTVAKQTLATLAGYQCNCQAFLAWQEENNVGEGDWEEAEAMEVPDDDADLDA